MYSLISLKDMFIHFIANGISVHSNYKIIAPRIPVNTEKFHFSNYSKEMKRTLRVKKNCLYFNVELFLELMFKSGHIFFDLFVATCLDPFSNRFLPPYWAYFGKPIDE